ncbi:MAG TPA: nitrous oxide reductase accessory protein NosL [Niabella sp.]|nr:nitrous oxide reductase accessory protein NosL [Niabella sp.]
MKNNKLSGISKVLLVIAALFLIISLFVPVWSIYLDAPQYPEGLMLQIWAHKLGGDVEIINGLNHYIGMKTLHTNDFIEFTVLPYIIGAFALFFLIVAFTGKRKGLYIVLGAFILFGIVAMVDFWKWEYDYGHNLDPDAAIKVPGMFYQPPLIGFKQLLNFGAYSIPAAGGWLFVAAGLLLVAAVIFEKRLLRKVSKTPVIIIAVLSMFSSCSIDGPEPVNYNKDACASCKMSISESRFAAELITEKGRVYKFDDISCMLDYIGNNKTTVKKYYIADFMKDKEWLDAAKAFYVRHEEIHSPMGGNIAAFETENAAKAYTEKYNTNILMWEDLLKKVPAGDTPNNAHVH